MPCQWRMDYPSAVHHAKSRRDRRGDVLEGDVDRQTFMVTLAEAGQKADWQCDSMNRLTHLMWRKGDVLVGGYSYSINAQGLRVQSGETNNGIARSFSWYYDSLRRMVGETVSGGTAGSLSYVLDSVGNRTSRSGSMGGLGVQSFQYDRNDWMDNDTDPSNANAYYDAQGNPVQYQGTHQYDWADRLTNFNSGAVSLVYDAEGNRVKKVANGVTTLYLVAAVNPTGYPQVVEELTVSGGVTNLARVYDYGLGLWCQRSPGGTTRFYGADGHGSVRFLTDGAGAVTDTYAYDAYGNLLSTTGNTVNPYRYTGQQWDNDLGMYYLRARYYKPDLGRFWTMDTYMGRNEDPLSLHKYLYCYGNPVNRIDPSGRDGELGTFLTAISISVNLSSAYNHAVNKQYGLMGLDLLGAISGGFGLGGGLTFMESMLPQSLRFASAGAAAVTVTAGQLKGLCAVIAGTDLLVVMAKHHLMTDKNTVSDAPNGQGPWTPKFEDLMDGTGIELSDDLNLVDVVGHYGPHPEANQYTYDFLVNAVKGCAKGSAQYKQAITEALQKLGKEASTPGTTLNKLLTDH